jgi:hypothetical protein
VTRTASPPTPSRPAVGGEAPDASTFLQLCGRWPDGVPGEPIPCDDLVRQALADLPGGAGSVHRVETSYPCTADACEPGAADRADVRLVSDAGAVVVEVARGPDGSLEAATPAAADPAAVPPFDPPPASAPVVEGAPVPVNDRAALPWCGHEVVEPYGPHDPDARRCLWDALQAGSPAELVSSSTDTEGRPSTTIYRYAGTGGLEVLYDDETGWFRLYSGLEPVPDDRVFDLAGLTTAPQPVR